MDHLERGEFVNFKMIKYSNINSTAKEYFNLISKL